MIPQRSEFVNIFMLFFVLFFDFFNKPLSFNFSHRKKAEKST